MFFYRLILAVTLQIFCFSLRWFGNFCTLALPTSFIFPPPSPPFRAIFTSFPPPCTSPPSPLLIFFSSPSFYLVHFAPFFLSLTSSTLPSSPHPHILTPTHLPSPHLLFLTSPPPVSLPPSFNSYLSPPYSSTPYPIPRTPSFTLTLLPSPHHPTPPLPPILPSPPTPPHPSLPIPTPPSLPSLFPLRQTVFILGDLKP